MSSLPVLISRERIAARVRELGEQITEDLARTRMAGQDDHLVLMPVLTGALVFVADLIRHIPAPMTIRPVTISSYPGKATTSQGTTIQSAIPTDLVGSRVLIVDDILDSGRTLGLLRRMVMAQHPAWLRVAVLLQKHKPSGRDEHVDVDYVGFDIHDEFVVGYGLDHDGYYRNLPDVAMLPPSADE